MRDDSKPPPLAPLTFGTRSALPQTHPRSLLAYAAGMAAPYLITGGLAVPAAFLDLPTPTVAVPLAPLLIVAAQAIGVLLARELELPTWRRVWLLLLATTLVPLPLVALHASVARVPFVSIGRGSASPLVWTAVAAMAAVVGVALLAAIVAADAPDQASLLFLPTALVVPAMLGFPGEIDERAALRVVVEVSFVAAAAAFFGWAATRGARPLVAPVALAFQLGVLWALGYRPPSLPGQGDVVPILGTAVLVLTGIVTVFVPLVALAARRVVRLAQEPTSSGIG